MYVGLVAENFNPRSYKRSDVTLNAINMATVISIHAPTRGATRRHQNRERRANISIHAPTRGATRQTDKTVD